MPPSQTTSLFLDLPQELRDHIYSHLLDPINATTEHPFTSCFPPPSRFNIYKTLCLVSRTIYSDVKSYFTTHIAPHLTFYLTTVQSLRHYQRLAYHHPLLQDANFHIRCGTGTGVTRTRQATEEIESLIRIQPGFPWHFTELPGFHRARPNVQTNYGYFPATGPHAWKPRKYGIVISKQMGGEVCDSPICRQRDSAARRVVGEVTEVQYPPLQQWTWLAEGSVARGSRGSLSLSCFIWDGKGSKVDMAGEGAIMALQGNLKDVWIPEEDVVKVDLRQRAARMG